MIQQKKTCHYLTSLDPTRTVLLYLRNLPCLSLIRLFLSSSWNPIPTFRIPNQVYLQNRVLIPQLHLLWWQHLFPSHQGIGMDLKTAKAKTEDEVHQYHPSVSKPPANLVLVPPTDHLRQGEGLKVIKIYNPFVGTHHSVLPFRLANGEED
jgi:hypothetical protein